MPTRPRSIVWFDIAFGLLIALGIAQAAMQWDRVMVDPRFSPLVAKVGAAPVYGIAAALILALAVLWYFIAHRRSTIAKWLFVLLSAYTLYDGLGGLIADGWPTSTPALLTYASLVLQVLAAALLFMPDTKRWFGNERTTV